MKALITGGTGFIGSHLAEALIKKGFEVYCLVRDLSNKKWLEGLEVNFIEGDCCVRESLEKIKKFDYIFHLAGLTKASSWDEFYRANVKGTENIIDVAIKNNPGLKRFILLSSLAAAGPSDNGRPKCEDSPATPVSAYGKSKLLAEEVLLKHKESIPFTILRPTAVYGPRDRDFFVFFKMVNAGIMPYFGKAYYSLIYVEDLVKGIILGALRPEAQGKIYFLADGSIITSDEIAFAIAESLQKKPVRIRIPRNLMPFIGRLASKVAKNSIINNDKLIELRYTHWICDISRARDELGFNPKVNIREGMKWTANWYRLHRWL
ncbi:MAG: NAD(P)-dependent oxidoreductase [Thermodesulfovibrionales bacterium]|nr:NAD(P)-dependent oxidoreductase [Thermodesulfovibrionales bacterium]